MSKKEFASDAWVCPKCGDGMFYGEVVRRQKYWGLDEFRGEFRGMPHGEPQYLKAISGPDMVCTHCGVHAVLGQDLADGKVEMPLHKVTVYKTELREDADAETTAITVPEWLLNLFIVDFNERHPESKCDSVDDLVARGATKSAEEMRGLVSLCREWNWDPETKEGRAPWYTGNTAYIAYWERGTWMSTAEPENIQIWEVAIKQVGRKYIETSNGRRYNLARQLKAGLEEDNPLRGWSLLFPTKSAVEHYKMREVAELNARTVINSSEVEHIPLWVLELIAKHE